jgi:hypothetical protein
VSGAANTKYTIRQKTYDSTGAARPSGFIVFPGRYVDTKGFLSWNNKLQDNYYYQEFSYVLRLTETVDKYKDIVKSLLHPAGTIMFGDYIVNSKITLNSTAIDQASVVIRRSITETIIATDTPTSTASFTNGMNVTESVTSSDSHTGRFTANTSIAESVTSAASHTATFTANTQITESVASTETPSTTFLANTQITESVTSVDTLVGAFVANTFRTESVTSVDTLVGIFVANTSRTESVTSTAVHQGQRFALMSSIYSAVKYANNVISVYETSLVSPYATVPVGALDGTPRLVTSGEAGAQFANGALRANTGSISLGGVGSNLYIITTAGVPVGGSPLYQVNAIVSNTAFTIRTNFVPTSANVRIWYSTGP